MSERCTQPDLGYIGCHLDAERRLKAGRRQLWCGICGKWVWPEFAGTACKPITARQFAALVRRAEREAKQRKKEA